MTYLGAIHDAWSRESSADPTGWTAACPAYGQCAVTALVVQDLLGGGLLRTINAGTSHYWNILPDGTQLDLTRSQFDKWEPGVVAPRPREYLLSNKHTAYRYELLRKDLGWPVGAPSQETAPSEGAPDGR